MGCGGDSNRLKKVFIIAQKKAIRNAFGVRIFRVTPKFYSITIKFSPYTTNTLSEAYQLMNNPNHPVLLSEDFSKSLINSTRFHHNFTKSHYSYNINNFVHSVPSIWNALNSVSKFRSNFSNMASFKKAVKEFLLNIQSYGNSNYWEPVNFSVFNYISATSK